MFVLLKRAHALADRSLKDFGDSLSNYSSEDDLKILRIGYVICRRRREMDKCKLIALKIEELNKEFDHDKRSN